jgi:hypothetical protein
MQATINEHERPKKLKLRVSHINDPTGARNGVAQLTFDDFRALKTSPHADGRTLSDMDNGQQTTARLSLGECHFQRIEDRFEHIANDRLGTRLDVRLQDHSWRNRIGIGAGGYVILQKMNRRFIIGFG